MRTFRRFLHDIRALVRGRTTDDDLSDELDTFLKASVADKMQSGMSREEATRTARLEMGSPLAVRDAVGDVGWTATWEATWRDVRYGIRSLARNGNFTLAAVTTLALGVGVTTAVFSIVNTVLLQPLPYQDSDRLVRVVERAVPRTTGAPLLRRTSMTWSELMTWRARSTTLSELAYTISPPITLMSTPEGSARLSGALVSPNLFSILGAHAQLGRTLDIRDEAPGSNTVVISAGVWQRYFHGDPGIIGRTVALKTLGPQAGLLDGTPLTIVGVMAHAFDFPVPYCDYWAAITAASPVQSWPGSGQVIARLRHGISAAAATDEANVIGEALRPKPTSGPLSLPLPEGARRFDVEPFKEQAIAASRSALTVLALAVGVVLLIACANVATLLLARGTARHREVAVRLALGASRSRIARQLLTESVILTAIGGGLGVLLAVGGVQVLRSLASPNAPGPFLISFGGVMIPRLHEVAVDGWMLAIAAGLSAFTALVISVLPVLRLSQTDQVQAMGVRAASGVRHDTRLRNLLLVGQVASATVLLVGAGLLVNSFGRLTRVDPGWNASGLLTFYLAAPQEYTTQRKAILIDELLMELRRTPGVQAAGFTYAGALLGLIDYVGKFVPAGRTPEDMPDLSTGPHIRSVSHDFLQTMGVRLRAGRWLEPRDDAGRAARDRHQSFAGAAGLWLRGSRRTDGPCGRSNGPATTADRRCGRRHAAGAPGPGADSTVLRRLSTSARLDAGEADACSPAGTSRVWLPVVRRANGWRPSSFDADDAIADRSGRLDRRNRRDGPDGPARGVFADATTVQCSRHGRVCRDSGVAERGWHLRRAGLRRRATYSRVWCQNRPRRQKPRRPRTGAASGAGADQYWHRHRIGGRNGLDAVCRRNAVRRHASRSPHLCRSGCAVCRRHLDRVLCARASGDEN